MYHFQQLRDCSLGQQTLYIVCFVYLSFSHCIYANRVKSNTSASLKGNLHMFPSKKNTCSVKRPKLLLLDVLKITQPDCTVRACECVIDLHPSEQH